MMMLRGGALDVGAGKLTVVEGVDGATGPEEPELAVGTFFPCLGRRGDASASATWDGEAVRFFLEPWERW